MPLPLLMLVYGTDYLGRTCGVDSPVQNMRYTAYPRTNEDFVINVFKSDPLHFKFYGTFYVLVSRMCLSHLYNLASPLRDCS